jgi:type II secretory pathway pseudopilin PulG
MRIPVRSRLGFSLTELVAVLVVTLVLAAVAVPTYRAVTAEVRQDAVTTSAKALRNHLDALAAEEQVPTATYDATTELGLYNEDPEKITAAEYSSSEILVTGVYGSDVYYACITLAETVGGTSSVADGHCAPTGDPSTPIAQTIIFAQPSDVLLSQGTRSLTATASSGLPVSFSSSTNTVCTVSGSTVTLLSAGTCTITASQAGGTNNGVVYMAAPPVARSFTVNSDPEAEPFPLAAAAGDAEATLSFAPVEGAASYTGKCWTADLGEEHARSATITATGSSPEEISITRLENQVLHTCKVYADVAESEEASVLPLGGGVLVEPTPPSQTPVEVPPLPCHDCPDTEGSPPGTGPATDGGHVDYETNETVGCPDEPITSTTSAACGGGSEIGPVWDLTNHYSHSVGVHHLFLVTRTEGQFGFTKDHSDTGPNYRFAEASLRNGVTGAAVTFGETTGMNYGSHPARRANYPGTSSSVMYLTDSATGNVWMVDYPGRAAYLVASGFSSPTGISWAACLKLASDTQETVATVPDGGAIRVEGASDCLYVADASGLWRVPLKIRCTAPGYTAATCPVGSRQPAVTEGAAGHDQVVAGAVRRVFISQTSIWTSHADRIVRRSLAGAQLSAYTDINPYGLSFISTYVTGGNSQLIFTDIGDHRVKSLDVTTGVISTVAGSGSANLLDGTGSAAAFSTPRGVTFHGNWPFVYIADTDNSAVRRVNLETGEVLTLLRPSTLVQAPTSTTSGGTINSVVGDGTALGFDYKCTPSALDQTLPGNCLSTTTSSQRNQTAVFVNGALAGTAYAGGTNASAYAPFNTVHSTPDATYVVLGVYHTSGGDSIRPVDFRGADGAIDITLDAPYHGGRNAQFTRIGKLVNGSWVWVSDNLPLVASTEKRLLTLANGDLVIASRESISNGTSTSVGVEMCRVSGSTGAALWCRANSVAWSGSYTISLLHEHDGRLFFSGDTQAWPKADGTTLAASKGYILEIDPATGYALTSTGTHIGSSGTLISAADGLVFYGARTCTSSVDCPILRDSLNVPLISIPAYSTAIAGYDLSLGRYVSRGTAVTIRETDSATGATYTRGFTTVIQDRVSGEIWGVVAPYTASTRYRQVTINGVASTVDQREYEFVHFDGNGSYLQRVRLTGVTNPSNYIANNRLSFSVYVDANQAVSGPGLTLAPSASSYRTSLVLHRNGLFAS